LKKVIALLTSLLVLTSCSEPNTTVRLATHDSFVMSDELIAQFEQEYGYQLEIIRLGDAGTLTNHLILTKNAPIADLVFNVDDTFGYIAEDDIFTTGGFVEIDYADVCFNYDIAWFEENRVEPPKSWRELTDEKYRGLTVITNPRFSSPGLAFLATTYAGFETSAEVFEYWRNLRDNGLKIAGGWEDAYFTDFTRYGGTRPIVLSYASSPAAEVKDGVAATAALLDECFRQIEYASVIEGAKNRRGAEALIDFMLSEAFQSALPEAMYVYPAVAGTPIPESWATFALPARSNLGDASMLAKFGERWLKDWSDVFDN
jgi:thiamine transport system substrate-binding protein